MKNATETATARTAETAEVPASPVSRLLALADPPAVRAERLASGRSVVVEEGAEDLVTVRGPEGEVELRVRFTATGPVLTFAAAAIDLKTEGRIDLDCGRLRVRSEHGIEMRSGGDLVQNVEGHHVLRADGGSTVEAHTVEIRARAGDVKLHANDDARIEGERVLLNS
jgi:hypothetical protein